MPSIRFPGAYPDGDMTDTTSLSNFSVASDDGTYFTALEYPESQQRTGLLKARKVSVVPTVARVAMLRASSGDHSKASQTPRGAVAAAARAVPPTTSSVRVSSTKTAQTPTPTTPPALAKPTALSVQRKRSLGQALYIRGSEPIKPFIQPCAGQCHEPPNALTHMPKASTSTAATVPSLISSRTSSTSSMSSCDYGEWRLRQSQVSMGGVSSVHASEIAVDPFRPRIFQSGRPSQHGSLHLPSTPGAQTPSAVSSVYATEVEPFRPRAYQASQTFQYASLHLPNEVATASSSAAATKQAIASASFPRRDKYTASVAPSNSSRVTGASSLFGRDLSNDPFRPQVFAKPDASKHTEIYLPKASTGKTSQGRTATHAGVESLRSKPSVSSSLQASLASSTKSRKVSPLKGLGKKVTSILSRSKA